MSKETSKDEKKSESKAEPKGNKKELTLEEKISAAQKKVQSAEEKVRKAKEELSDALKEQDSLIEERPVETHAQRVKAIQDMDRAQAAKDAEQRKKLKDSGFDVKALKKALS